MFKTAFSVKARCQERAPAAPARRGGSARGTAGFDPGALGVFGLGLLSYGDLLSGHGVVFYVFDGHVEVSREPYMNNDGDLFVDEGLGWAQTAVRARRALKVGNVGLQ